MEALAEDVGRGRLDEDEDRAGSRPSDGARALNIDLEKNGLAGGEGIFDWAAGCPVAVPVDVRVLDEPAGGCQLLERSPRQEVVVDPVALARTRPAGRSGDGKDDVRTTTKYAGCYRRLTGTRGAGDNEKLRQQIRLRLRYRALGLLLLVELSEQRLLLLLAEAAHAS
jgi:hypothetical protein